MQDVVEIRAFPRLHLTQGRESGMGVSEGDGENTAISEMFLTPGRGNGKRENEGEISRIP